MQTLARLALGAICAGFLPAVTGSPVTTTVTGTFNRSQENGCLTVSTFFYRVDCSHSNRRKQFGGKSIPWVGPDVNPAYYAPDSPHALPHYTPKPGDDRIEPTLTGTVSIDRQRTDSGHDDTVSAKWIVGPAARNIMTRVSAKTNMMRVVETWQAIEHEMPATIVDAATCNDAGGYDYVIASRGFPQRICLKDNTADCFPSALAPWLTDGKWGVDVWSAPGDMPIGHDQALGGNVGAKTTGVFVGYRCIDNTGGAECARGITVWGSQEDPGLDNVLLLISTDSAGRVVRAEGFWTNEYRIGVGPKEMQSPDGGDDSWLGGYLQLTGEIEGQ